MSPIILKAVISCSSEDSNHPAENLIKSDKTKKWKCNSWESSVSVVLELAKETKISGIDIGNEHSAFVEVLVGRSSTPNKDFQVLLVASSFMSPLESRGGTNANRVRMFAGDQLSKPAAEQKWDRVKVVCTQPFNKHVKFGLSFLALRAPASSEDSQGASGRIGQFVVKDCDDVIPVGSLFKKRKQLGDSQPLSGAAAIREASSPAALAKAASKPAKGNPQESDISNGEGKANAETKERIGGSKASDESSEDGKASSSNGKVVSAGRKRPDDGEAETAKGSKREVDPGTSRRAKKPRPGPEPAAERRKPFEKLLEGVMLVISGYQNPHRSNVRCFALEMGAKYQPDWTDRCTHLICAFQNTPKFRQVKGKGKIVTKEWIEECYIQRKRLPWRRFALDKKDKSKNESEDEILELKDEPEHSFSRGNERLKPKSGSDTDDDIQIVQVVGPGNKDGSNNSVCCTDPYDDDTDVDSDTDGTKENHPDTSHMPLPFLPTMFDGKTFYLSEDLGKETRKQLQRYIIAFKGKVLESLSAEVHLAVANSRKSIKEVEKYPHVTVVRSSWVWACNDEGMLLPTSNHLL